MKFQKSAYITVENGENLERIGFCKCKLWPHDKTLPLFGSLRYVAIQIAKSFSQSVIEGL